MEEKENYQSNETVPLDLTPKPWTDIEGDESAKDNELVQSMFDRLIETYKASPHRKKVELITKAFNFANKAHAGVRRLSGEPYITHPLAVAQIVCGEIGLGSTSICAALLHDVVEDTDYTVEDISNIFGEKIAQIVDGLTKISGGIFGDKASAQAESFKKLLLTMSDDIRVILIKISDRLHNMRTLGSQPPHKQYKIAGETLYIYAPLAHRLGLNLIKEELEDLSFQYEHPEAHADICARLNELRPHLDDVFKSFIQPIRQKLDRMGLTYDINARIKRPYSIWAKMRNKHVGFEEIYDLLAVRIVFDPHAEDTEVADCFQIYAACTSIYKAHPDRFRDWLSTPKSNGYRALHTTLMSPQGRWIELQIRSRRMDDMAERGFAAHWKYKEGTKDTTASETELEKWLSTIKEILDDPQPSAMDFLSTIKLNLYSSEILVITPKGEFRTMPAGSTALDFAFSIHTVVGTHCMGAKVNHQLVPINHVLKSGDQVEILTSKDVRVKPDWVQFATTAKARGKIEVILRRQRREHQKVGEEMLAVWCQEHELEQNSLVLDRLCMRHMIETREELFQGVGAQTVILTDEDVQAIQHASEEDRRHATKGWTRYIPFYKRKKHKENPQEADAQGADALTEAEKQPAIVVDRKKPLYLNEENITRVTMCPHCHPIPGDEVLGYIDQQNRVIIHKRRCDIADKLKNVDGNRILAVFWDTHKQLSFPATLRMEGIDRVGIIRSLADVITSQLNVNVHSLSIAANDGIFQGDIELSVHDTQDLSLIIKNLRKIDGIESVTRVS
ncbi:MAG: bifunctional (p)ppGpp synthetase/guanosine-3',5'-bis(diphosphate) 3'-pyrophosphohydrolase [Bacteroidaceae bacterium]|nr:bifunctional (p)ppGpp synthetase/guanosine-3',5'-bis(diphosphate) 3'-pyrophosphohydrolase [Bacteroidaceae bacterium]